MSRSLWGVKDSLKNAIPGLNSAVRYLGRLADSTLHLRYVRRWELRSARKPGDKRAMAYGGN